MNRPGFVCEHCSKFVPIRQSMGTQNRNHCLSCLWSKHLDDQPGDRNANCGGMMEPLALTFKEERQKKYGIPQKGEIMIVHNCTKCSKLSLNRIAADDNLEGLEYLFKQSQKLDSEIEAKFKEKYVKPLVSEDYDEFKKQLFGKIN